MTAESTRQRVLAEIRRRPSPVRSDRRGAVAAGCALAGAAMLGVLALWGGPAHAAGRPLDAGVGMIGGTLALALLATWLALPPRRAMLSRPAPVLLALALALPVLLGAWLVGWHPTYQDPFVRSGALCFGLTVAAAPWPFAALVFATRRFEPRLPGLAGAALGAAAGAWAAVVAEVWCPLSVPDHVAVGHALPVLLLSAAGALAGRWLLRLRRA
jgi:hypothetical protein